LIDDLPDGERISGALPAHRPERIEYIPLLTMLSARTDELGALSAYHAHEVGLSVPRRETEESPTLLAAHLAARPRSMEAE
jgi:hypothetical protein